MADFAGGFRRVVREGFPPLEQVTIGLRSPSDVEELLALVPELDEADPDAPADGRRDPGI
jgi:hypothetical protein